MCCGFGVGFVGGLFVVFEAAGVPSVDEACDGIGIFCVSRILSSFLQCWWGLQRSKTRV